MTKSEFQAFLKAIKILRDGADDKTASAAASLFPSLRGEGTLIEAGTRMNINGEMYRARTAFWDFEENTPDKAPNLWEKIEYKEGYRHIPQTITAENPFSLGEKAWWKEELMESTIDNNVWTPDAYPAGWKKTHK